MKNRAALVLMEQLIVILVFALSAALCLLAFSHAHRLSAETARQDRAVELAATGCELLKAHRGDLESAAEILDGDLRDGVLLVSREDLSMEIRILDTGTSGFGQADVRISEEQTGVFLYSLTVSWQEVSG